MPFPLRTLPVQEGPKGQVPQAAVSARPGPKVAVKEITIDVYLALAHGVSP